MFKFNFAIEEDDLEEGRGTSSTGILAAVTSASDNQQESSRRSQVCQEIPLEELLDTLPESITYSPLPLPFLSQPLLRRDLHDARFQLASSSAISEHVVSGTETIATQDEEQEQYVDAVTDLIPGLYEGGLKTWEGGVDLVEVLSGVKGGPAGWIRGSSVLEVGCGTALPSTYLFRSLLGGGPASAGKSTCTVLHVQDYNRPVLSLVSLPNLLLAALPFLPPEAFAAADDMPDVETVLPDLANGGELLITPALKAAFLSLLDERGVTLRFSWGGWVSLAEQLGSAQDRYGLVLTAETIYAEDSVDELISVLRNAIPVNGTAHESRTVHHVDKQEVALEESLGDLAVAEKLGVKPVADEPVILVAAKVLYFGVGGGLQDFIRRLEGQNGWTGTVREWIKGVGRKVIRVGW